MSRRYTLEWQILPPLRMCLLTSWVSSLENRPSKSLPILLLGCLYLFMPSDSRKYTYHVLLLPSIHRGRNWGSEGPNNLFQTHTGESSYVCLNLWPMPFMMLFHASRSVFWVSGASSLEILLWEPDPQGSKAHLCQDVHGTGCTLRK